MYKDDSMFVTASKDSTAKVDYHMIIKFEETSNTYSTIISLSIIAIVI